MVGRAWWLEHAVIISIIIIRIIIIIIIIRMQKVRHAGVQLTFGESFSSSVKLLWKYYHKLL